MHRNEDEAIAIAMKGHIIASEDDVRGLVKTQSWKSPAITRMTTYEAVNHSLRTVNLNTK